MSQLDRARWLFARLRAMSPEEIGHRLKTQAVKAKWKREGAPQPARLPNLAELEQAVKLPFFAWPTDANVPETEINALLEEAESILRGEWRFFAFADGSAQQVGQGRDWFRCDRTGLRSEPDVFGPDFDYRDASKVGNVKYTWEKSRHHHTTVLALTHALTGEDRYAQAAFIEIHDWLAHNPAPKGLHWSSGIELGVRLIAWAWCFHLLRNHPGWAACFASPEFLTSLYQHQAFLAAFESRGSSANNHLAAEVAGLYIAAMTWPVFPESAGWQRQAKAVLEEQLPLQWFESGLNREMAFDYHLFALEIFLLPLLLGASRGDKFSATQGDAFSDTYRERMARAIQVIADLRDVTGHLPRFGDSDEGYTVQLQSRHAERSEWLLEVGRRFFGLPIPPQTNGRLVSHLLLPFESPLRDPVPPPSSFAYEDAGLYVLAANRNTPQEVLVLADAGPLGFLAISAHGHADALNVTLNAGGQPVLIDPGTFVYHTDLPWRKAFKSTRAHNTLELDGQDQSVQAGAFLWSHKANTHASRFEPHADGGLLIASHDGYARLPGKPTHERQVDLRNTILEITDTVTGSGTHKAALYFHLHADCEALEHTPGVWKITWAAGHALMRFDAQCSVTAHRSEEESKLGWYSPRFDVKVPTWTLRAVLKQALPLTVKTQLEVVWG